jgi:hypothetical protein
MDFSKSKSSFTAVFLGMKKKREIDRLSILFILKTDEVEKLAAKADKFENRFRELDGSYTNLSWNITRSRNR